MAPQSIIEKIWDARVIEHATGHPAILGIDFMLIHEVTSAQAFEALRAKGLPAFDPKKLLATLDHSIPTRSDREVIHDPAAANQVATLRRNSKDFGIVLCDYGANQGVVHVIGPELGVTQPGMTIVCGDSHTATHGAFGALAFGIGTSEVATVMATGCLLQQPPKTMRVEFTGSLQAGVYAKDAILKLITEIGVGGANGHVIEYCGEAIERMTMAERMTICNMSIECGARAGLVGPDQTTYAYLKGKRFAPADSVWGQAVAYWESFKSDPGCTYNREVKINLDELEPMVTWGTNPSQGVPISGKVPQLADMDENDRTSAAGALKYVEIEEGRSLAGVPINWAFVGSCTNGRIEDLRIAAEIVKGRRVAKDVTFYVVPGSEVVREQAILEGLDKVFETAGAHFRMPGCSLCLAMNDDRVPAGQRCISSSNRNFVGRQGTGSRTHLASPATVAASAVAGCIASPLDYL